MGFLRYLKQAKVPLNEFEFSWSKIADIQLQLEKLITKNYFLNQSAKEAFKSYVRAYDSHQLKSIFNVDTLDLAKVALSFGFTVPPVVDLSESNFILSLFFYISITSIWNHVNFLFLFTEMTHKIRSRPEKRVGGGGYGKLKAMNKTNDKNRKFKQIDRNKSMNKKFERWLRWLSSKWFLNAFRSSKSFKRTN